MVTSPNESTIRPTEILGQEPVEIPPGPVLHTRWGSFQGWWNRSDKTSEEAEARLLSRLQFFTLGGRRTTATPGDSKTIARSGLVELSGKDRKINTLVIEQIGNDYVTDDLTSTSENTNLAADDFGYTETSQTHLDIQSHASTINSSSSEKKNLVMCHGYGAGLGFFYRNYHSLSQIPGWRIYAIDWLGMGRSSRPKFNIKHNKNRPIEEVVTEAEDFFVDSLEEWREIHKIEKMTLMGHSLGGYLASVYALRYPERVEKLVLVSPAGIPENPNQDPWTLNRNQSPAEATIKHEKPVTEVESDYANATAAEPTEADDSDSKSSRPYEIRRRQFAPWALKMIVKLWEANVTPMSIMRLSGPFGPSLVGGYVRRRFAHLSDDDQQDLHNYLYHISAPSGSGEYALATILAPGAFARLPLIHRLHALKMPTAFLYGESDWMDYRAAEAAVKTMSVPTTIARIPSAGHHLYLDNPTKFDEAMIDVLVGKWDQQIRQQQRV